MTYATVVAYKPGQRWALSLSLSLALALALALAMLGSAVEAHDAEEQRAALLDLEQPHFDHYVLALTWHPGFCGSRRQPPRECRDPALLAGTDEGFVLHGLWPSRPDRWIAQGLSTQEWQRQGCFIERPRPAGDFCQGGPAIALSDSALEQELTAAMPGSASCLDRYEYAKHGACMGMTDDQYFDGSLALVEIVNDSALGAFVRAQRGRTVARRDLIAAFEESFGRGSGRALALVCGGPGNRLLTEIRVGIEAEHVDDFPARHSLASVAFGRCPARIELRRNS